MFSQYPRPSDYPQENSDLPSLKDIRIMGYAMRTKAYRFVEWVAFNHTSYEADFDEVCMQFRSNWLFPGSLDTVVYRRFWLPCAEAKNSASFPIKQVHKCRYWNPVFKCC